MPDPIRVLCIDDNPQFTGAWERLLNMQPDMKAVGSRPNADDLVAAVKDAHADLVLMDLTMSGRDPLEAVKDLTVECPHVRVLVCSGRNDHDVRERSTRAGAWGYVDKLEEPQRILDLIRGVSAR